MAQNVVFFFHRHSGVDDGARVGTRSGGCGLLSEESVY